MSASPLGRRRHSLGARSILVSIPSSIPRSTPFHPALGSTASPLPCLPMTRDDMTKTIIQTEQAPQAIGTYSQAVKVGKTVYLSGQIPLVPETMELVTGDMEAQIRRVFDNLAAVAAAAGGGLGDMVKLNVYLTDLGHFPLVNQVMASYFQAPYPARAAVGVAALPKGAAVEMDGILALP